MKKILTILAILLTHSLVFAQAPQKMSYQAVIRNAANTLITNQSVGMQISVLQGTATGTAVYVETQTATTNANGLVSLEIGAGTVVSGTFASINWATGNYYIKTETDPTGGTSYTVSGTSQLLSVPYALFSANGDTATLNAWNKTGNTGTNAATHFIGTTDNVDLVFKRNNIKAGSLSDTNTAFGVNSLVSNTTGLGNTANGSRALYFNTTGDSNIANGEFALYFNTTGLGNTGINQSLFKNTTGSFNVGAGFNSLYNNTTGDGNVGIGTDALSVNITGTLNTGLGRNANVSVGNLTNATAIGANATVNASNKVQIGNGSVTDVQLGTGTNTTLETGAIKLTGGTPGAGKVLTSDAAGLASWTTPAASGLASGLAAGNTPYWNGTTWITNSSNIFNNGGNVGIGTTTPTNLLEIGNASSGSSSAIAIKTATSVSSFTPATYANYNGGVIQSTYPAGIIGQNLNIVATGSNNGNWPSNIAFHTRNNGGNNASEKMILTSSGNLGIGTNAPVAKLDVTGNVKITDGTQGAGKVLTSDAAGLATWATPASGAPYYNFVTPCNQSFSFPVGTVSALLMVSMKENCLGAKGAVSMIHLDCTTNTVQVISTSPNNLTSSASITAATNVLTLNNDCQPMMFTFNVVAGVATIVVTGQNTGIITSKWIVMGV